MTTKTAAKVTATCKRCHATLTDPKSVARRLGRVCARKRAAEQRASEVIAKHQPAQVDKAIELIGDSGILPTGHGLFLVVSSAGDIRYETSTARCSCKAGQFGRLCYHRVAAELMLAAA